MDMYLKSENVKVFPCSAARSVNNYGSVLNEDNITNILKSVTDKESFLISTYVDLTGKKIYSKFVLEGYYFDISIPPELVGGRAKQLFATCNKVFDDTKEYSSINTDKDGNFIGLTLSNDKPVDSSLSYIMLLDKNFTEPKNKVKLSPISIEGTFENNINLEDDLVQLKEDIDNIDITSQIQDALNKLDINTYFTTGDLGNDGIVTKVTQTNGKISVTKVAGDTTIILECGNSNIFK